MAVLPGPPRILRLSEISWFLVGSAQLAGFRRRPRTPETPQSKVGGGFGGLSLGHKIPFPGNGECRGQRRGSNAQITATVDRASGAGATIQPADRRGEQLPYREGGGRRWRP